MAHGKAWIRCNSLQKEPVCVGKAQILQKLSSLEISCARLLLEPHEEIEDCADVLSTVHEIAGLNQDCVSTRPMSLSIDQSEVCQELCHRGGGPLDLADHDNVGGIPGGCGNGGERDRRRQCEERQYTQQTSVRRTFLVHRVSSRQGRASYAPPLNNTDFPQ